MGRDRLPEQVVPVPVTVDLVVLTVRDDCLQLLTIERVLEPYQGRRALPGGFLRPRDRTLHLAALRELKEEAGLDGRPLHLEQLGTYGDIGRDSRGRVVSVAFLALAPDLPVPKASADARDARWSPVDEVRGSLAFDHDTMLTDGLERARAKLEYTTLATQFCPPTFTIGDLRRVYEVVWGTTLDPRNFNRKVASTEGFVRPTGEMRRSGTGRPAALYERGEATALYPPMLRRQAGTG
jgi:8-oxo-dGTP diphosphatase